MLAPPNAAPAIPGAIPKGTGACVFGCPKTKGVLAAPPALPPAAAVVDPMLEEAPIPPKVVPKMLFGKLEVDPDNPPEKANPVPAEELFPNGAEKLLVAGGMPELLPTLAESPPDA